MTYKKKRKFYLKLDEVEWEAGYKLGISLETGQLEALCEGKTKAFCSGVKDGQEERKAKEGDN